MDAIKSKLLIVVTLQLSTLATVPVLPVLPVLRDPPVPRCPVFRPTVRHSFLICAQIVCLCERPGLAWHGIAWHGSDGAHSTTSKEQHSTQEHKSTA